MHSVQVRHVFGTRSGLTCFMYLIKFFLEKRGSDHRPVLVKFLFSVEVYIGSFMFDKSFLNKPNVKQGESMGSWLPWKRGDCFREVESLQESTK